MKANWILCLAAGLIGGVISHFAVIAPVYAQVLRIAPREVRAQQFVLVDDKDQPLATFIARQVRGNEIIQIIGNNGRVLWSVGGPLAHPIALK
jgi:hypothetical protein